MKTMKRIAPKGNTVVSPYLMVESVESLIEFLVKVFNATVTNDSNRKDGFIQHGEVLIGDTTIMLGRASKQWPARQSMNYVFVENADETYNRALKNGATAIMPPGERPYGIREGGFTDKYGNQWWVGQLIESTDDTDENQLAETELNWSKALERNDVNEISKFMTDDWVILGTEGGITHKDDFLDTIKSGDLVHTVMDSQVIQSRVYNNAGVIISRGTSAGTYKNNTFSYFEWSTSVFVKEGGRWKSALTMITPAVK